MWQATHACGESGSCRLKWRPEVELACQSTGGSPPLLARALVSCFLRAGCCNVQVPVLLAAARWVWVCDAWLAPMPIQGWSGGLGMWEGACGRRHMSTTTVKRT
jgi:hypothetical protein